MQSGAHNNHVLAKVLMGNWKCTQRLKKIEKNVLNACKVSLKLQGRLNLQPLGRAPENTVSHLHKLCAFRSVCYQLPVSLQVLVLPKRKSLQDSDWPHLYFGARTPVQDFKARPSYLIPGPISSNDRKDQALFLLTQRSTDAHSGIIISYNPELPFSWDLGILFILYYSTVMRSMKNWLNFESSCTALQSWWLTDTLHVVIGKIFWVSGF